ncbi:MAG TPA: IS200/IS605 family transposase [Nitrospira sp.]|nr:IS200/IS605 family transposase [Nitrospira sp.]
MRCKRPLLITQSQLVCVRYLLPWGLGSHVSEMGVAGGDSRARAGVVCEIAAHHGFEKEELEVNKDQVHLFLSVPPRYSISAVVRLLKAVSAKEIREEFPEVWKQLWGGEYWEDWNFVRTVGDKVTVDVIWKYIRAHKAKKRGVDQLDLF